MALSANDAFAAGRRRGRRGRRSRGALSEINVTPLVDVMMVLLIIFMISAPLLTVGVPLELPKTSAGALNDQNQPIGQGYLVDYDSATGQFSHWASFSYPNTPAGTTFLTHFEGISELKNGVYTLAADSAQSGSNGSTPYASFVTVPRNRDGSFGPATWVVPDLKPFGTTM